MECRRFVQLCTIALNDAGLAAAPSSERKLLFFPLPGGIGLGIVVRQIPTIRLRVIGCDRPERNVGYAY